MNEYPKGTSLEVNRAILLSPIMRTFSRLWFTKVLRFRLTYTHKPEPQELLINLNGLSLKATPNIMVELLRDILFWRSNNDQSNLKPLQTPPLNVRLIPELPFSLQVCR